MIKPAMLQQIIARRLPVIAEQLQILADDTGIDAQVTPSSSSDTAQLTIRGPNLMRQQFGDPDKPASAPMSGLLHSLAQIRRHSS